MDDIRDEIESAKLLGDYEAVDVLWVAFLKISNNLNGRGEKERMTALVNKIPSRDLEVILNSKAVNSLLDLDPPLESVLSNSYEQLQRDASTKAIAAVRKVRNSDPRNAMLSFGEILKRIRNKRAHGFKSAKGKRDREILRATRIILLDLCDAALRLH
jgi:hypothetical protein